MDTADHVLMNGGLNCLKSLPFVPLTLYEVLKTPIELTSSTFLCSPGMGGVPQANLPDWFEQTPSNPANRNTSF